MPLNNQLGAVCALVVRARCRRSQALNNSVRHCLRVGRSAQVEWKNAGRKRRVYGPVDTVGCLLLAEVSEHECSRENLRHGIGCHQGKDGISVASQGRGNGPASSLGECTHRFLCLRYQEHSRGLAQRGPRHHQCFRSDTSPRNQSYPLKACQK